MQTRAALGHPALSDLEQTAFERFFMNVAPTLRGQSSGSMKRDFVCLYLRRGRERARILPPFLRSRCLLDLSARLPLRVSTVYH